MRKLVASIMLSLDGYCEGANRELGWLTPDAGIDEYMAAYFSQFDTILLGRVTYELFADFWPHATGQHPNITRKMNTLEKLVLSNTVTLSHWAHTRFLSGNVKTAIEQLKEQPGRNIVFFGGARTANFLFSYGLIDELQLFIYPVLLGKGTRFFQGGYDHQRWLLRESQGYDSGVVRMVYAVDRKQKTENRG